MALTFNPVSVNLPTPPSFAGGQMGAPVDANPLSSLAKLTDIQATRQGIATSQQALAKAQATYGADVSKAESEAKQKATEAQNAAFDYQNKEYNAFQTVISPHASDASVLAASKLTPQSSPEEVKKVQEGLLNLGESTVKELMNRGVSKIRAYQLVAPHFAETMTDPKLAAQNINLAVQKLAGPANIAEQNQPKLTTINGQPTMFSPQGGVVPVQGLQQPEQAVVPAVSGGATAPSGVSAGQMNMPPMQYPVRKAGAPYAQLPTEPKDIEVGQAYRNNLVNNQVNLTTMRRNIDEVIKEVNILGKNEWGGGTGVVGKAGRELSIFLGTEQGVRYKQLSKDLANTAISAIKASGGSLETDAGKQLTKAANGDETFPPSVVNSIAQRTNADFTNIDMQATAAQKFANLYGDQNSNTFKKLWADNADSKIFELKNIFDDPTLSKEEKEAARNKLLGNNPNVIKQFTTKWNNIKKLEQTGHL